MYRRSSIRASLGAIIAISLLAGCASKSTPAAKIGDTAIAGSGGNATAAGSGGSGKSIKTCTVTMIPKSTDNPYFAAVHTGMDDAQKELGGTLSFVGPAAGDVTGQIQRIQSATQQGSCAIGIAALDAAAVAPALKAAAKRGIKVFSWDGDVIPDARGLFVNMSTAQDLGLSQFKILANAMHNKGEWVVISSQSTAESKNLWITAMQEEAKKPEYSAMKLDKVTFGDDDSKKSYDLAVSLIRAYPNLQGIMAPTPIALEASAKAVADLKVAGKVVVTGLGNPGNDANLLKNGQVPAYVLWSPRDLGYLSYYAAAAYISGKLTGKQGESFAAGKLGTKMVGVNGEIIMGPPITFTKTNVDAHMKDFEATK